jgi:outer membrane protein assembly factor BamB
MIGSALLFACLPVLAPQATSTDWPQFQGPNRTGQLDVSGLEFKWGEDGPEELWRVPVGPGFGGVAIRDDEVFLLDRFESEEDVLRVFELETGEGIWDASYSQEGRLQFPGSRSVPTVERDFVYTVGGHGKVVCFDREAQEIAWAVDMQEEFDGELPMFGWSNSPLVIGDVVIVTPLGESVGLLGLDRFNGSKIWSSGDVGRSHSTPVVLELCGETQVLFMSARGQVSGRDSAADATITSFNPADGSVLWQYETLLSRLPIPPPIRVDAGHFFITGGYRGGSTLVKIEKQDDKYAFEDVFHITRGAQIHQPLLHEDHLYVLVNENWNDGRSRRKEGGLLCLDLEGNERWRTQDDPFFGRGNALMLGEHILIQDGFNGILRVVRAASSGYEQIAEANIFGIDDRRDHQMWAPMAYSRGLLLLRSQEHLLCLRL